MTFDEIRKNSTDPELKKSVHYLYELSNELKVDISMWNVEEIFGDLNKPVGDLNRIFLGHVKRLELDKKMNLDEATMQKLAANALRFVDPLGQTIDSQLSSCRQNIQHWSTQIANEQKRLWELMAQRDFSNKEKVLFVEQIMAALKTGFWEIKDLPTTGDILCTMYSNEIVLAHPQGDGRDFKLNFGQLLFKIDRYGWITAEQARRQDKANVRYGSSAVGDGYFFPFIKPSGEICYGNAAGNMDKFYRERRLADLLQLLQAMLTTYPGGTPYQSLVEFFMNGKDRMGNYRPWAYGLSSELRKLYGIEIYKADAEGKATVRCTSCRTEFIWNPKVRTSCTSCGTFVQVNLEGLELVVPPESLATNVVPSGEPQSCPECDHEWDGSDEDACPECGGEGPMRYWRCNEDEIVDRDDDGREIFGCGHEWSERGAEPDECPNCNNSGGIYER